jgi:hypothetical protein
VSTPPVAPTGALAALATLDAAAVRALTMLEAGQMVAAPADASAAQSATPAPATVVSTATQAAATQQSGLAPLFADLATALQAPNLPSPVAAAAARVQALATPIDPPPTAADLKSAIGQSGLLLEATIAATGAPPANDLKAALLVLRQTLANALEALPGPAVPALGLPAAPAAGLPTVQAQPAGLPAAGATVATVANGGAPIPESLVAAPRVDPGAPAAAPATAGAPPPAVGLLSASDSLQRPEAPTAPVAPHAEAQPAHAETLPAPPYRDAPLHAQAAAAPRLPADAPAVTLVRALLQDVNGALARQVLYQLASLPGAARGGDAGQPRWMFELPLVTPQGATPTPFEIGRDGGQRSASGEPGEPAWRARFSLDLGAAGPVHARLSLVGGKVRVGLWAEHPQTAAALDHDRGALTADLAGQQLGATVTVLPGQPAGAAADPGQFVDRAL